jgi:hypothetical protein
MSLEIIASLDFSHIPNFNEGVVSTREYFILFLVELYHSDASFMSTDHRELM